MRGDLLEAAVIVGDRACRWFDFQDPGTIDRYFEALEAGTLKAELCNEKVRNLRTRMEELEGEGPNPKKKHLLHRLLKKVLIYDRRTIEIWYGLPNQPSVRTPGNLAPWAGLEPAT